MIVWRCGSAHKYLKGSFYTYQLKNENNEKNEKKKIDVVILILKVVQFEMFFS